MKYQADLGTWEKGRVVEFDAKTPEHALRKATKMLKPGEDCVVQIYVKRTKRYVYDYMNGFSIYQ